ncbi:MAG: hypothetical protein KDG49_20155, partial [Geminicoccaceae bacterium]|nr:hypothetical protein [Geminicoccaceae bacterium]
MHRRRRRPRRADRGAGRGRRGTPDEAPARGPGRSRGAAALQRRHGRDRHDRRHRRGRPVGDRPPPWQHVLSRDLLAPLDPRTRLLGALALVLAVLSLDGPAAGLLAVAAAFGLALAAGWR